MTVDVDLRHYQEQEAADLRRAGWTVEPPDGERWAFSRCIGLDGVNCPVRTPRQLCHFHVRSVTARWFSR